MRTVDFFVRGKDKYLPIQFAKEMLGNILPVLRVDSSKRCIDNKRQGTAADILKLAINRILCGLPERAWLKPILQIHDELTFIIPKDKLKEAVLFIKACMEEQPFPEFDLPLVAEASAGETFGSMEELEDF